MDDSLIVGGLFDNKRARLINSYKCRGTKGGGILYWMSRDQRVHGWLPGTTIIYIIITITII